MNALWVWMVDSHFQSILDARLRAVTVRGEEIVLRESDGYWIADDVVGDQATIEAQAAGFAAESNTVNLRDPTTQVVIGLRRPGEIAYSYGDNRLAFARDEKAFLLRLRGIDAQKRFAITVQKQGLAWRHVSPQRAREPDRVHVEIAGDMADAERLTQDLHGDGVDVQILRVVRHGDRPALGLSNDIVVRFRDDVTHAEANAMAQRVDLHIARSLHHAGNAFVLTRAGPPSYELLDAADALARSGRTIYVEPDLAFTAEQDQYTPNDPLWAQVPHLRLINADDAWERLGSVAADLRGGSPSVTIAVIDDEGVTPDHPELIANVTDGTVKLVESMNFAVTPIVAQTAAGLGGDHGTQCAGTATAAFDDARGLPGVAPNCRLLAARIDPNMTAVLMADVYLYAAGFLNGSAAAGFPAAPPARAADVISSSWGVSGLLLSNTVRDCFDFLTSHGRGGKGCVLCFSIGNTGYLDFTAPTGPRYRAWAAYEKVLGIGASVGANPTNPVAESVHPDPNGNTRNIPVTADTRALYSPYGGAAPRKPDLVSPSSTAIFADNAGAAVQVDPILSAVRVGMGAVNGCTGMAVCNDYDRSFGGTSHCTPAVAGAVALMLSVRPGLNWMQVREILRQSCVRVDAAQPNAIGRWRDLDGDGQIDYSRWYGAGRLDVDAAVALALDPMLDLAKG